MGRSPTSGNARHCIICLTSRLSSAEIILSKLSARLLQVGVLVALGDAGDQPDLGLFGGIDFQLLLVVYAATFTTMFFLASASILVSVIARRPREAIIADLHPGTGLAGRTHGAS